MNLIFDLDGTLIQSKPRLYHLFQHLVPNSSLSYETYWELKQGKQTHEMILEKQMGYSRDQIATFVAKWMDLIESPEFLKLDENFEGMCEVLADLSCKATLHVCTARQLRAPVLNQLDRLGLSSYFTTVLVTELKSSKETLIKASIPNLSSTDWIIGDTGKDIQAGQALGLRTCAVLTGFQKRETLQTYNPDIILSSVREFEPGLA